MKKQTREENLKDAIRELNALENINDLEGGWEKDIEFHKRVYELIWWCESQLTNEFVKWWMRGGGGNQLKNFICKLNGIINLSNPN